MQKTNGSQRMTVGYYRLNQVVNPIMSALLDEVSLVEKIITAY